MKSTILIFCLTLLASQLTEPTTGTPVLDLSGDEVLPDVDYYIRSAPFLPGNLTLKWRNINTGLTVARDDSGESIPVRFHPKATNVTLNADLHVFFQIKIPGSTAWKLRSDGDNIYVAIQGLDQLFANWFKIEEVLPLIYKFVFRPDVDVGQDIISGNIGLLPENGVEWLGLAKIPYAFVLEKA